MKLVVAEPPAGQGVGGRRVDGPAEGARHPEAHVVDEDHDDVRSASGSGLGS